MNSAVHIFGGAAISVLAGGGLPKYTEESSWEATLIAEPRPVVGGPGNRFQSELDLMGFSQKSRNSLREAGILEQPGANGRETHIGLHFLFSFSLLICNSCYSFIRLP